MERESFESPEIAAILNKSFVPIKIDREERPDIDAIYMNYVQVGHPILFLSSTCHYHPMSLMSKDGFLQAIEQEDPSPLSHILTWHDVDDPHARRIWNDYKTVSNRKYNIPSLYGMNVIKILSRPSR
jgi:hypothetical protein